MSLSPPLSFPLSLLLFLTSLLSTPSPSSSATISSFSISLSPWHPTLNQTLLSPNSIFAAGFHPIPTSPNLFTFSIWYHNNNISTVKPILIWSANQNSPVTTSAALEVTPAGQLRLAGNSSGQNLWPSSPVSVSNSTELTLSDKGELVFGQYWSSFDFPTDTIVATQNISGKTISSRNGKFSFENSTHLVFNGSDLYWSSDFEFQTLQEDGRVVAPANTGSSLFSSDSGPNRLRRLTLDDDGNLRIYSFNPGSGQWVMGWEAIREPCTIHGTCGPNSICITDGVNNTPSCICPPGFRPLSGGCERNIQLTGNTKFIRLDYVNFSDGSNQTNIDSNSFAACQRQCLSDRKCLAFGFKYSLTGIGQPGYCMLQLERLLNGYWNPDTEIAMFLRVDMSEPDDLSFTGMMNVMETTCPVRIIIPLPPKESCTATRNIIIASTLFAAELISGLIFFWVFLKKYIRFRASQVNKEGSNVKKEGSNGQHVQNPRDSWVHGTRMGHDGSDHTESRHL